MVADIEAEWLTLPEAAKLLKISTVTLHRWIKQGRLPGYHVGPRKVRIRRQDLAKVFTPTLGEEVSTMKGTMPMSSPLTIRPLTDEEIRRGLAAIKEAETLRKAILARRKGKPFSSSAPLIRRAREERSKQLLNL